jgi:non-homologous end joining protein Ku
VINLMAALRRSIAEDKKRSAAPRKGAPAAMAGKAALAAPAARKRA